MYKINKKIFYDASKIDILDLYLYVNEFFMEVNGYMPVFYVDEEILDCKLECVVCPIKGNQLYFYADIDALIYKKAGFKELEREFFIANPFQMSVPALTNGLNLSKYIIHIIGADMIYDLDFKTDIYNSYDRTLRLIKNKKFIKLKF